MSYSVQQNSDPLKLFLHFVGIAWNFDVKFMIFIAFSFPHMPCQFLQRNLHVIGCQKHPYHSSLYKNNFYRVPNSDSD